jgi:hypothetical protein
MRLKAGGRRHPGRFLIYAAAAATLTLAVTIPGFDDSKRSLSPARKVTAPAKGAYLGSFVNTPGTKKGGTFEVVLANLPAFTQQIGRNLAIVAAYQPWMKPWATNAKLTTVADTYGAIPMVSWHCGDSDERVASGKDDALIAEFAQRLKEYGGPVFLRWFWEPNLPFAAACLGPGPTADQAARYVAAYRRIARIFDKEQASNVAFVWSVATVTDSAVMKMYYPGDKYVDWIAADGYDRLKLGRDAFTEQFRPWYLRFKSRGKPMAVTETGATTDQPEFLQGVAEVLPRDYPKIKAFVYFDSVAAHDWRLSSYGGAGIPAFAELGRDPYFAAMPKP